MRQSLTDRRSVCKLNGSDLGPRLDIAEADVGLVPRAKPRVVKAAEVRRAELIDCAQALFLSRGYERTTINDVIAATGLSKGAFYHHFRSKEDLLEAIAERVAAEALSGAEEVRADPRLDALKRLNLILAATREWKAENLAQLRAMFTVLLRPDNAVLYHRILRSVFAALGPVLIEIIEEGEHEGVFDVAEPALAAEALLWLGEGRRALLVEALELAERGELDAATARLMDRLRGEEATIDRLLGLPPGSVQLIGSEDYLRTMLAAWNTG